MHAAGTSRLCGESANPTPPSPPVPFEAVELVRLLPQALSQALQAVQAIATYINENKRQLDSLSILNDLQVAPAARPRWAAHSFAL